MTGVWARAEDLHAVSNRLATDRPWSRGPLEAARPTSVVRHDWVMDEPLLNVSRTWTGQWWRPDEPDDKIPGVLSYEPATGMRLDLIGGWDNHITFPGENGGTVVTSATRDWPVILGVGDGKLLTLLDNFGGHAMTFGSSGNPFSVPDKQTVITNAILVGCHLSDPDEAAFLAGIVTVENLTEWSKRSGIHAEIQWGPGASALGKIELDKLEPIEADLGRVSAKLHTLQWSPYVEHRRSHKLARVKEHSSVEFSSDNPRPFREWMTMLAGVRDLMALSTLTACAHITTRVYLPPTPDRYPEDHPQRNMRHEVAVYQQHLTVAEPDAKADLRDFILTLEDIPFDVLMPRWTALREKFSGALGMILGMRYISGGYLETQVVSVVAAAESFHRSLDLEPPLTKAQHRTLLRALRRATPDEFKTFVADRLPWNGPTLRNRLLELVARLGEPGAKLIPNANAWATAAKDARNKLAHTGASDLHGNDVLDAVAQVTSALVVLNLLHELGLPEERLMQSIERHRALSHAATLARRYFTPQGTKSGPN